MTGWVRSDAGLTGRKCSSAPISSQLRTLQQPVRNPTLRIDRELAKARGLRVSKHCPLAIARPPVENGVLAAGGGGFRPIEEHYCLLRQPKKKDPKPFRSGYQVEWR